MFYQCYNKTDYVYINFFITIRLNHIFLSLHELSLLKNNIHLKNVLLRLIRNKNINFRKRESFQLRYFGSCIGESNFDIRSFEFLNSLDYGNLNPKKTELSKNVWISTFLVELHLDVVLEVFLVVGFKFIFYKVGWININGRFTEKLRCLLILNFNFNVPCRTSPT